MVYPRLILSKSSLVGGDYDLNHGDVVIAAITSCTNTSNPGVMLAAGLLARECKEAWAHGEAVGKDLAGTWFKSCNRIL